MTRTIHAREITPGTLIEYSDGDITPRVPVHQVAVLGNEAVRVTTPKGRVVTLPITQAVTVLTEPVHVQPKEPTAFGARVLAGSGEFLLSNDGARPWKNRFDGKRYSWDEVCDLGPVTVVEAAPSWGAPTGEGNDADAPRTWDQWADIPVGTPVALSGLADTNIHRPAAGTRTERWDATTGTWVPGAQQDIMDSYAPFVEAPGVGADAPTVADRFTAWPEDDMHLRAHTWVDRYQNILDWNRTQWRKTTPSGYSFPVDQMTDGPYTRRNKAGDRA